MLPKATSLWSLCYFSMNVIYLSPLLHMEAIAVDTDPKLLPLNVQITVCFGEPGNM